MRLLDTFQVMLGQSNMPIGHQRPRPIKAGARKIRPFTSGPIPGESEGEVAPAGHEVNWRLDQATKDLGKVGLASARAPLTNEK